MDALLPLSTTQSYEGTIARASKSMNKSIIILSLMLLSVTSCSSNPTSTPTQVPPPPQPYPGPTGALPVGGVVPFKIDRPVKAGDTHVKGSGPIGVPIVITNVTLMGDVLGGTVIDSDHRFDVQVPPLQSNTRIGLEIADLTGTDFTWDQFQAEGYKGEGALLIPLVGYFQDTVMVQP